MDIADYIVLGVVLLLLFAILVHTNTVAVRGTGSVNMLAKQQDQLVERINKDRELQARHFRSLESRLDKAQAADPEVTPSPLLGKKVIAVGRSDDGKPVSVEGTLEVLEHRREPLDRAGWHIMNVLNAKVAGVEVSRATVKLAGEKDA